MDFYIKENGGMILLNYLKNELSLSRNEIKRLKNCGGITVNGHPVTVRYTLGKGDRLSLEKIEAPSQIKPCEIPLNIVYEDSSLLAVNKPSGMAVHPSQGNHGSTLAEAVMFYFRDAPFVFRPVNRLDKYTSGLVIIAKNAVCCSRLCEQIKKNLVEKHYIGITEGIPEPRSGMIKLPIARSASSIIKREINPSGKPSATEYEVISENGRDALVKIHPLTGRTHQIRVHMAALGCPLKYDFLYGNEAEGKNFLLHCERLKFIHPANSQPMELYCQPPFKFSNI